MARKRRQMNSDEVERYGRAAWRYFDKLQKYKAVKSKFDAIKDEFESEMESMFHGSDCNSMTVFNYNVSDDEPNALKVTKVERTSIKWDVDKLRKRIPSDIFKQVVHKEYRIVGMPQLIAYLKSCGVDPSIFKQHIVVEESVDQDAIDKMGELGYISAQRISGCYVVECNKPFFKVSLARRKQKDDA